MIPGNIKDKRNPSFGNTNTFLFLYLHDEAILQNKIKIPFLCLTSSCSTTERTTKSLSSSVHVLNKSINLH